MKRKRRVNCWEFKKCGRQPEGSHSRDLGVCPAATTEHLDRLHEGTNGGRACWFVVGTLCNGDVQGTYAKKYKSCVYCDFYKKVKEEEYSKYRSKAINTICKHFSVKPFPGGDGITQSPRVGFQFSAGKRAYCTQTNSLCAPGTLMEAACKGDVANCDITLEEG
jgi:hypothetical protein